MKKIGIGRCIETKIFSRGKGVQDTGYKYLNLNSKVSAMHEISSLVDSWSLTLYFPKVYVLRKFSQFRKLNK